MNTMTQEYTLDVGETYRFNFPGAPGGKGTFLGWTSFGWIVLEVYDRDTGGSKTVFYNLANLNALEPCDA